MPFSTRHDHDEVMMKVPNRLPTPAPSDTSRDPSPSGSVRRPLFTTLDPLAVPSSHVEPRKLFEPAPFYDASAALVDRSSFTSHEIEINTPPTDRTNAFFSNRSTRYRLPTPPSRSATLPSSASSSSSHGSSSSKRDIVDEAEGGANLARSASERTPSATLNTRSSTDAFFTRGSRPPSPPPRPIRPAKDAVEGEGHERGREASSGSSQPSHSSSIPLERFFPSRYRRASREDLISSVPSSVSSPTSATIPSFAPQPLPSPALRPTISSPDSSPPSLLPVNAHAAQQTLMSPPYPLQGGTLPPSIPRTDGPGPEAISQIVNRHMNDRDRQESLPLTTSPEKTSFGLTSQARRSINNESTGTLRSDSAPAPFHSSSSSSSSSSHAHSPSSSEPAPGPRPDWTYTTPDGSVSLLFVRSVGAGAFSSVWLARDLRGALLDPAGEGQAPLTPSERRPSESVAKRSRDERRVEGLRPTLPASAMSFSSVMTMTASSGGTPSSVGMGAQRSGGSGGSGAGSGLELDNPFDDDDRDEDLEAFSRNGATHNGGVVAVKMMELAVCAANDRTRISFVREVEVLRHISHPNIVSYLHSFTTPTHHCLVTEFVGGGELFDVLNAGNNFARMSEPLLRRIWGELVSGAGWMHQVSLVHRDIKLENILLTVNPFDAFQGDHVPLSHLPSPLVKITDFGLARFIDPASPLLSTRCGSEYYAAPEIIMGKSYDGRQADAWACGVVLYALATRVLPFDAHVFAPPHVTTGSTDSYTSSHHPHSAIHGSGGSVGGVAPRPVTPLNGEHPSAFAAGMSTSPGSDTSSFSLASNVAGSNMPVRKDTRRSYMLRIAKGEYRWPGDVLPSGGTSTAPSSRRSSAGSLLLGGRPRAPSSATSVYGSAVIEEDNDGSGMEFSSSASGRSFSTASHPFYPLTTAGVRRMVGNLLVRDPAKRARLVDLWQDEWLHEEGAPLPPPEAVLDDGFFDDETNEAGEDNQGDQHTTTVNGNGTGEYVAESPTTVVEIRNGNGRRSDVKALGHARLPSTASSTNSNSTLENAMAGDLGSASLGQQHKRSASGRLILENNEIPEIARQDPTNGDGS